MEYFCIGSVSTTFSFSKYLSSDKCGPDALLDVTDKTVSKPGKNFCPRGTSVQVGRNRRETHKKQKYVVCSKGRNAIKKNKAGQEPRSTGAGARW